MYGNSPEVLADRSKKYDKVGVTGEYFTAKPVEHSVKSNHLNTFSTGIHRFVPEPLRPCLCCVPQPPPPAIHHTYHTHHQQSNSTAPDTFGAGPDLDTGSAEDVLDAVRLTVGNSSTPDEIMAGEKTNNNK